MALLLLQPFDTAQFRRLRGTFNREPEGWLETATFSRRDVIDGKIPTYVFPVKIHSAVRERFPEQNAGGKDEQFEKQPGVYHVSLLPARISMCEMACNAKELRSV